VFAAKERGAKVVAAVRAKHMVDAKSIGADWVISTEDDSAIAKLPAVEAVADTVAGETAQKFIGKVKSGGIFASVLPPPGNAKEYPSVKVVAVGAHPDSELILRLGRAVQQGKLKIPISRKLPLKDAAAGHAAIEGGVRGKVLLLAQG
jgi:NADPH:quinone reductase-like Zn-dependent oxidoreductase